MLPFLITVRSWLDNRHFVVSGNEGSENTSERSADEGGALPL